MLCLNVYMCTMCMPSTCTGQKKGWLPGNWSYRKL